MPTRVPAARPLASTAHACVPACPPSCAATALDELLFVPDRWFAIDSRNVKVPGVTPGTLDQALGLLGRGHVASIVGQLRPEVLGVDVDAAGGLGDAAADLLAGWCASRGLWHLLRPSGGGPGRWHLLVVPGVHRDALLEEISKVRRELRLTRSKHLEARTVLRPLSAPHRRTGAQTPPDGLQDALSGLQTALEPVSARILAARAVPAPRRPAGGPTGPLTPLPRPRRDLPLPWAAYLARGRRAAAAVDRDPTTRSLLELQATTALVLAGYTEAQAWQAITSAHPGAFNKARSRGRTWWWNVWNRAVVDADDWLRARRAAAPPTAPASVATTTARAHLEALWRSWPARTRHTDHEVLTVVLDRMDRAGATAVAIPQRDLVLDCAVSSRTTVRAALARLQAAGLLTVHATYQPGTTDTAHTLALPEHLTSPSPTTTPSSTPDSSAVSVTDPSRFQPPHRRPPLPLRRSLGLPACALHTRLPDPAELAGTTPTDLAHAAGLLDVDQEHPTPRQLRTVRTHLRTLASLGLAQVDEHGHWRATTAADQDTAATVAAAAAHHRGAAVDQVVRDRVDAERAEFRQRFDAAQRRAAWERQRQHALARAAKAARARQKAWWNGHDAAAAHRRRTALAAAFAALSPDDQAKRKHYLAAQRARAGEDERARYDTWLTTIDRAELDQRSAERALTFRRRPVHEQHQFVAAWTDHRARWALPHHSRAGATPRERSTRLPEDQLLRRLSPAVDDMVLFDVSQARSRYAAAADSA